MRPQAPDPQEPDSWWQSGIARLRRQQPPEPEPEFYEDELYEEDDHWWKRPLDGVSKLRQPASELGQRAASGLVSTLPRMGNALFNGVRHGAMAGGAIVDALPLLATAAESLRLLAVSTAVIPWAAVTAAGASLYELSQSFPDGYDELQQAWFGMVGGVLCGAASAVAAGFCVWLGCIEFAARAAKSASGALAAQLAEGASFGSAAARRDAPPATGWHLKRGWQVACSEGGLFEPRSSALAKERRQRRQRRRSKVYEEDDDDEFDDDDDDHDHEAQPAEEQEQMDDDEEEQEQYEDDDAWEEEEEEERQADGDGEQQQEEQYSHRYQP